MHLNNHENIIRYPQLFSGLFRRRQRRFSGVDYSDRSAAITAMNAHLRASARSKAKRPSTRTDYLDAHGGVATRKSGSFLNLMRQYDNQARDNFSKEAILFAIITAIGVVWPIVYTLSARLR